VKAFLVLFVGCTWRARSGPSKRPLGGSACTLRPPGLAWSSCCHCWLIRSGWTSYQQVPMIQLEPLTAPCAQSRARSIQNACKAAAAGRERPWASERSGGCNVRCPLHCCNDWRHATAHAACCLMQHKRARSAPDICCEHCSVCWPRPVPPPQQRPRPPGGGGGGSGSKQGAEGAVAAVAGRPNELESRLRRDTPFICNIRFKNDLPEIPAGERAVRG
jgi:hypothetical protein